MKLCSFSGVATVLIMSAFPSDRSLPRGTNVNGRLHSICGVPGVTHRDFTCFITNLLNSTKQMSTITLSFRV